MSWNEEHSRLKQLYNDETASCDFIHGLILAKRKELEELEVQFKHHKLMQKEYDKLLNSDLPEDLDHYRFLKYKI